MPIKTLMEMPIFRSRERIGVPSTVAARFSRAIARFMQNLLAALHESRFEKARREIDSLRHLIPAVTSANASLRCGDQPARGPARRSAEARRTPSHVA
jgi:hypothetical protein